MLGILKTTDVDIKEISKMYGAIFPTATPQISINQEIKHIKMNLEECASIDLIKKIESILLYMNTLNKIFLTIPTSTSSAERSFSLLRRVKNFLRNRISQDK